MKPGTKRQAPGARGISAVGLRLIGSTAPRAELHPRGRRTPGRRAFAVVAFLLVAGLAAAGLYAGKRALALRTKVVEILHNQELLLEGYRSYTPGSAIEGPMVLFVGHVYGHNGLPVRDRRASGGTEEPFRVLRRLAAADPPAAVVFGGDSIYVPDDASLLWLQDLQADLPMARFVLGNHENAPEIRAARPALFTSLFRANYWSEDLDGVRMVYLDTMATEGEASLGRAQRTFLAEVLDATQYRYALVFLHHRLWDGRPHPGLREPGQKTAAGLRRDWSQAIVPLLVRGNVKGVFAGDSSGLALDRIGGIPHYGCGWDSDSPVAWLGIHLAEPDIHVVTHRLDRGRHLIRS